MIILPRSEAKGVYSVREPRCENAQSAQKGVIVLVKSGEGRDWPGRGERHPGN